jgi:NAD(P)-dependent dehydrogenase (short-subunit alcohol dehydrogenase family)
MVIIPTKTSHKKPYPAISPERAELSQAGRTILVTGGGMGIGFAICRAFITAAASRIIIVGRRTSVIDDAIARLTDITKSQGRDTIILGKQCDIADLSSSKALWDELAEGGIVVDTLVLNAATQGGPGPILERGTTKVWQDLTMNVQSTIYFTERFYKQPSDKKVRQQNER